MNTMSGVGPIIIAGMLIEEKTRPEKFYQKRVLGVFSATLSSALASLISAPKVFQVRVNHRINISFPIDVSICVRRPSARIKYFLTYISSPKRAVDLARSR